MAWEMVTRNHATRSYYENKIADLTAVIAQIRSFADDLSKTDWRGHKPAEHYIADKLRRLLDGEQE